jgi:hypothetical protein
MLVDDDGRGPAAAPSAGPYRLGPAVADYSDLRGGHLSAGHPAARGAAAAVPQWWRGEMIAGERGLRRPPAPLHRR